MSIEIQAVERDQEEPSSVDRDSEITRWIDDATKSSEDIGPIIERLTALTLPTKPWRPSTYINPLQGDLDDQCWSWNRAGFNLIEANRPEAAAEVWSALYLSLLALQQQYHIRYHKGMSLCNIGYAWGRARTQRGRSWAVKSWLLGVIEDMLSDAETSADRPNYQNLLRFGVAPAILTQLQDTIVSRFIDPGFIPSHPEWAVEIWLHPLLTAPSEKVLRDTATVLEKLARSYPRLPSQIQGNYWGWLFEYWSFADWSEGVLGGL